MPPPAPAPQASDGRMAVGTRWRKNRLTIRVVSAVALALGCSALLVLTLIGWTVQRADDIAADTKQRVLVHSLQVNTDKVPYDQESVAIWDDAIEKVRLQFDHAWVDNNIGVWMAEYFKHDRVDLLDDKNHVIYVHDSAAGDAEDATPAHDKDRHLAAADELVAGENIHRLITQLRAAIANGALDDFEAGKSRIPRVVDKILLNGRPAVVSLMPIVSDTREIKQERGTEYLLITYRYLDQSFIADLVDQHQLLGARFSLTDQRDASEGSLALTNELGDTIGYFIWTLPRPAGNC